jgi:hypothetical protein
MDQMEALFQVPSLVLLFQVPSLALLYPLQKLARKLLVLQKIRLLYPPEIFELMLRIVHEQ